MKRHSRLGHTPNAEPPTRHISAILRSGNWHARWPSKRSLKWTASATSPAMSSMPAFRIRSPARPARIPKCLWVPETTRYLRWLVSGVVTNRTDLDRIIAKYAPEWPVDQLAIIDRNVLRLALFEIGCRDADTPPKVVINEAVELAKRFGSDNSPRFVNGVLGSALDEVQQKIF